MKRNLLLALPVIALLVVGVLLGRSLLSPGPPAPPPPVLEEPRPPREVLLYFGAQDGSHLTIEPREIDFCPNEDACLLATVQALIEGPRGELAPILPAQTVLLGISVEQATATLDFSRTLIGHHPGGSVSELFTVYGLTNTLVANFPHIRQVKLLIEGQTLETLKGHVDLRAPLSADFGLARPVLEETPGRSPL